MAGETAAANAASSSVGSSGVSAASTGATGTSTGFTGALSSGKDKAKFAEKMQGAGDALLAAVKAAQSTGIVGSHQALAFSDERLKAVFGEECPVDCFARIHSYMFKYKPEAQGYFGGRGGVDNDVHYGVMAQELEQNPFTRSTVHTDPETGYKMVDTQELTMANTAAISDIMKELQELRSFKKAVLNAMLGGN